MPLHIINDYISHNLVNAVAATWPKFDWPGWHYYDDSHTKKLASKIPLSFLHQSAQLALGAMAELPINHPDAFPDLDLHGAGLHAILPGAGLGLHLDGATHPLTGWRRVCNAVMFVDDWLPEWGGELQLCDREGVPIDWVKPKRGTIAMFDTNDTAWHRVTNVTGPHSRRTLSLFWWQIDSDKSERTSALFK